MLADCALLEIPATSRISCLTNEHIKKLTDYHQSQKCFRGPTPIGFM
ncbi:hypothetical protein [Prochlorococcus sp. MIT 1307]|nr:hypothetical protein [Prochlorococcus sp. MIT 1307]